MKLTFSADVGANWGNLSIVRQGKALRPLSGWVGRVAAGMFGAQRQRSAHAQFSLAPPFWCASIGKIPRKTVSLELYIACGRQGHCRCRNDGTSRGSLSGRPREGGRGSEERSRPKRGGSRVGRQDSAPYRHFERVARSALLHVATYVALFSINMLPYSKLCMQNYPFTSFRRLYGWFVMILCFLLQVQEVCVCAVAGWSQQQCCHHHWLDTCPLCLRIWTSL